MLPPIHSQSGAADPAFWSRLQRPSAPGKDAARTTESPATVAAPSAGTKPADLGTAQHGQSPDKVRTLFDRWVGTTFYGLMLQSANKTVGKPAYFHGGRAEETFRNQLSIELAEEMAKNNGAHLGDSLFELSSFNRR